MESPNLEDIAKKTEQAKKDIQPELEKLSAMKSQLKQAMSMAWTKQSSVNGMPIEVGMMNRGVIMMACRDKEEAEKIVNILLPLLNK